MITAVLMIKNEAYAITNTLYSVLNCTNTIYILDTGSTDNTVDLVKNFFATHNVTGYISQENFIDFATSRNRALLLAKQHFPESTFFLMLDAEWYLHHPDTLIQFCKQEEHTSTPLYLLRIQTGSMQFTTARLFRASANILFKGVVHEVPEIPTFTQVPAPFYIEVNASRQGKEKSRERWKRDAELLLKSYQDNPSDPRTVFYLAQTYQCLGDQEKAFHYYQIRETLNGWDEENFITLFRLGCIAENLTTWATAMEYYLKAHATRPTRIEPLIHIADHYWPNNIPTCYLFSHRAYEIPYPQQDILFIEKEMYNYTRYEILSRSAWYVGAFELGEKATLLALKSRPDTPHLHNNLKLYQDKLSMLQKKVIVA